MKSDHQFGRRSSSAWAKKAEALRKISFARLSSRFSRSRSFNRCRSSVVGPARLPSSCSARRTHVRSVSGVQPILPAIDWIVAHWDGWLPICSKRRAGPAPFPDFSWISHWFTHSFTFSDCEASGNPGAVHLPEPGGSSKSWDRKLRPINNSLIGSV